MEMRQQYKLKKQNVDTIGLTEVFYICIKMQVKREL